MLEEARKIASLKHPGIVPVFDILEFQNTFLFVSEYVEGGDFGRAIASNTLSMEQKLGILKDVANALEYAHSVGIIHRDLKPSNILLDSDLRAKICDFKISLRPQTPPDQEHLGSLAYASPEQIQGAPLDSSTDIWSLGVVIFQAVTGRLPFGKPNSNDLISQILYDSVPLASKTNKEAPIYLDKAIGLCLEKSPAKRSGTAKILAGEISKVIRNTNHSNNGRPWLSSIFSKASLPAFSFAVFTLFVTAVFSTIQTNRHRQAEFHVFLKPESISKALNSIENWHTGINHGWYQTKDGSIRGEVSNHLVFNYLLVPPFKIEYDWKVVLGQRPRMMFYKSNSQLRNRKFITVGNEGFSKRIGLHGPYANPATQNRPKYVTNQTLNCSLLLKDGIYEFVVDDQMVAQGSYPKSLADSFKLALSAGDPSSPGVCEFKNFRFTDLSGK